MKTATAPANSLKGRISSMLCAGMSQTAVASVVGVDGSYISQLLAQEDFAEAVISARAAKSEADLLRDARLDTLEDTLIGKVEDLAKMPHTFMKPTEALRALQTINGLKRRTAAMAAHTAAEGMGSVVIELTLPAFVLQNFYAPTLDSQNNVVKIGDTDLITIQSSQMTALAASQASETQHEHSNHSAALQGSSKKELTLSDL